jgi:hypothetical protein
MPTMNAVQIAEPGADLVMVHRESGKSLSKSRPVGSATAMQSQNKASFPASCIRGCLAMRQWESLSRQGPESLVGRPERGSAWVGAVDTA